MKPKHIIAVAFMASGTHAANFSEAISGVPELSNMSAYITQNSSLESMFDAEDNVTILAPNNNAFSDLVYVQPNGSAPLANMSLISGILQYHILKGAYNSSDFTNKSRFIHSYLNDTLYTNVTDGQVVHIVKENDTVHCYSGLQNDAQVVNQV